ncbi:hypothetical protein MLD38_026814 [Melastoma candidum]|uniref:Uncharacterized protein n=1 Tax=Melastoma candidum TaxID=119954 RepID=A0ACB9NZS0_9MYRT|nr:hypothetical protein MLD38_026814 [Melastoma candidum]
MFSQSNNKFQIAAFPGVLNPGDSKPTATHVSPDFSASLRNPQGLQRSSNSGGFRPASPQPTLDSTASNPSNSTAASANSSQPTSSRSGDEDLPPSSAPRRLRVHGGSPPLLLGITGSCDGGSQHSLRRTRALQQRPTIDGGRTTAPLTSSEPTVTASTSPGASRSRNSRPILQ